MKIEYVHHSSFMIETGDKALIFDYFKGDINPPTSKNIYFFASHSHPDHYSPSIYDICPDRVKNYILSFDIDPPKSDKNIFINPNDIIEVDDMKIFAYGSTDEGISLVIEMEEGNIFYAGDHNDWYWEMEDTEEDRLAMHTAFRKEMELIKKHSIDLCFFPVDPRQKGQWDLGGRQVLEDLHPTYFFPMHFWNNYSITGKFKEKYSKKYKDTEFFIINKKNQVFEINLI